MTRDEKLDYKRRMARRRMAWYSFIYLMGYGSLLMAGLWIAPAAFAAAVGQMSGVLNMVMGVFTTVILGYLGFSAYESAKKAP